MTTPTPAAARSLLRQFLRTGSSFPDYNVREYIRRRARDQFKAAAAAAEPSAAASLLDAAGKELDVWRRQAAVYGLYHRPQRSIMEVEGVGAPRK